MCLYGGNRTLLLLKTRLHFPHGASSSAADMHDCWRLNLQPVVLSDKRSTEAFWERSAHIWSVAVVNHEIFILCYWTCNPISEMNYWFMLFVFPFFFVKLYDFPFFFHLCIYIFYIFVPSHRLSVWTDWLQLFPHNSCVTSEVSKVQYVVFLFWTDHSHHWLIYAAGFSFLFLVTYLILFFTKCVFWAAVPRSPLCFL